MVSANVLDLPLCSLIINEIILNYNKPCLQHDRTNRFSESQNTKTSKSEQKPLVSRTFKFVTDADLFNNSKFLTRQVLKVNLTHFS